MAWKKSPPELIEAFHAALPDRADVERRQMFGYPCAFVGGNMFTGLQESRLVVRLADEHREELLSAPGAARFEPMPGRMMKEYVVVPAEIVGDGAKLRGWVGRAYEYAASLPAKVKKNEAKKTPPGKKRRVNARRDGTSSTT